MPVIRIEKLPGFSEWRSQARICLQAGIPPHEISWRTGDEGGSVLDLFTVALPQEPVTPSAGLTVPKEFIELAEHAACHVSPERFALLYRILWRMTHENRELLHYQTDDDILQMQALVKSVRRDAYKIKAFLRFREIADEDGEPHYISWYVPEHYTLELSLPFFVERFRNMRWTILTPYLSAHWDGETLELAENPDSSIYPEHDEVEAYWLNYYASTFNPARVKKKAMLSQMPRKYWRNMPETALIEGMLRDAGTRVQQMIDQAEP